MPSSAPLFYNEVSTVFLAKSPRTVLDVGCGFGHWGVHFRNLGDVFCGRYSKEEWKTFVIGVEAHKPYRNALHEFVYDDVLYKNVMSVYETLPSVDFMFCGDMLEHLPKEDGKRFLDDCVERHKLCVFIVPLGVGWPQEAVLGNEHEAHNAVWHERDFDLYGGPRTIKCFRGDENKKIGMFVIERSDNA